MPETLSFRGISRDDIDELAALVADAFVGYRSWGTLAREKQTLAGHATFIPATRHSQHAAPDLALAHLGHLFVKPAYWGSGVAAQLLTRARTAANARGFAAMRLFVPAGQARARRFYTREGFTQAGEPFDAGLALPVLEYRRSLCASLGA